MSLQEDAMTIISLRPDGNHADLTDEYISGYIEAQAEDIINKVLDAVDNAIESVDYEDSVAGNGAINNALNAINKLRPES